MKTVLEMLKAFAERGELDLLKVLTALHAGCAAADEKIAVLEAKVNDLEKKGLPGAGADITALEQKIKELLESKLKELESKVAALPAAPAALTPAP